MAQANVVKKYKAEVTFRSADPSRLKFTPFVAEVIWSDDSIDGGPTQDSCLLSLIEEYRNTAITPDSVGVVQVV